MTLIETITVGDSLYDPITDLEVIMEDLGLTELFEEKWGIPPEDYSSFGDTAPDASEVEDLPEEVEAVAKTLDAAEEKYILSNIMKDGGYYIRIKKPVSGANKIIDGILSPIFKDAVPTAEAFDAAFGVLEAARESFREQGLSQEADAINDAHHWLQEYQGHIAEENGSLPTAVDSESADDPSPRFVSSDRIGDVMEELNLTGEELKSVLTPEEQRLVLEDYNNRVVHNFEECEKVDAFADVPGEIGGQGSYLLANIDRSFIGMVNEALERRDREYLQVPESVNARTDYAYIEV